MTQFPTPSGLPPITRVESLGQDATTYQRFCAFLEGACGITLGEGKAYLVRSRLARIMDEFKVADLAALVQKLEANTSRELSIRVIDAMTTNETLWFRDGHPFELLTNKIFPALIAQKRPVIRIWSAACSTGQEPYSISMVVSEFQAKCVGTMPRVEIIGTDISPSVLKQAERAEYEEYELTRGLSPERLKRFFTPVGRFSRVREEVKKRVTFRELNLLTNFILLGRFDIVFCRNVLIYFTAENKASILDRIAGQMSPGAYLFLGGSEPVTSYGKHYDMLREGRSVYYQRRT